MIPKVLIVDDDRSLTEIFKLAIPQQDFEVFTANSGPEGIKTMRQMQPDVIVLDLMMPDMDGWQVCREIRSFSQIPILVISAIVDAQQVMRALDEGADDYLVKPVVPGVLISRLKRLVRQAYNNRQNNDLYSS
jgi:two-component system KDP operon response regulator KdpE